MAALSEQRVASSALGLREAGLEDRALLVPPYPLGAGHLTNHQSARGDLFADVFELRAPRLVRSLLDPSHPSECSCRPRCRPLVELANTS